MKDIRTCRSGFCTEFRYESHEHSGLARGAILRNMPVLTLMPSSPCSFFQEQVPKMDSFPNVPNRKEYVNTYIYIYMCICIYMYICIYIYKYIYLTWAPARPPGRPPPSRPPTPGPCKVYVFVYVYAYVYVRVCVCVCVVFQCFQVHRPSEFFVFQ